MLYDPPAPVRVIWIPSCHIRYPYPRPRTFANAPGATHTCALYVRPPSTATIYILSHTMYRLIATVQHALYEYEYRCTHRTHRDSRMCIAGFHRARSMRAM